MKKFLSLFFSLLIFFSFAGTTNANAIAGDGGLFDQVVIRFTNANQIFFDPNEGIKAILSYSCENPYVVIEENPDVAENINSVLESYNSSYISADDGVALSMDRETYLLSLAEDYYSLHSGDEDNESFLFSFSHKCSVIQCDGGLLALAFTDYFDNIENTVITSEMFYFDLFTGNQLTEKEASEREAVTETKTSETGICEIFSEEQFAAENFSFEGLNAESFAVTDLLETINSGVPCFLCVSGEADNIRLSSVVYYDQWYEKQQLWFCSRMNNETLQLKIAQPTSDSAIKITYQSGGQTIEKILCADTSGDIFLCDPVRLN